MSQAPPRLSFRVSVPSTAAPEAVYDVLSDLRTHLVWAGEQAPAGNFRLLTMDAPARAAQVGDEFSSTGSADGKARQRFHDRSTVVVAERPRRFGFDTDATLHRTRAETWQANFATRYEIEPRAGGSVITQTSEVRPRNYVPYWLRTGMRTMTRAMIQRSMRRNLRNLAAMAEAGRPVAAATGGGAGP
jgi:hypothetical protein